MDKEAVLKCLEICKHWWLMISNRVGCRWLNLSLITFLTIFDQCGMEQLCDYFIVVWNFYQLCLLCHLLVVYDADQEAKN